MTIREWNDRWRNLLAEVRPCDYVTVHAQQGTFNHFHGFEGEPVIVSKWGDSPKKDRVSIHRKDVIRFSCLLKGVIH